MALTARAEDFEFFEKNVRPVLVENCYKCHSAESEKLKGGFGRSFRRRVKASPLAF